MHILQFCKRTFESVKEEESNCYTKVMWLIIQTALEFSEIWRKCYDSLYSLLFTFH